MQRGRGHASVRSSSIGYEIVPAVMRLTCGGRCSQRGAGRMRWGAGAGAAEDCLVRPCTGPLRSTAKEEAAHMWAQASEHLKDIPATCAALATRVALGWFIRSHARSLSRSLYCLAATPLVLYIGTRDVGIGRGWM
eukprot:scaffold71091_cov37-Tisochrysis_lutea.AAC.2